MGIVADEFMCQSILTKVVTWKLRSFDPERCTRVWEEHVVALDGVYEMHR